jgi:hypothetical protein
MIEVNRGLYLTQTPQMARLELFEAVRRDVQQVLLHMIHEHEGRD